MHTRQLTNKTRNILAYVAMSLIVATIFFTFAGPAWGQDNHPKWWTAPHYATQGDIKDLRNKVQRNAEVHAHFAEAFWKQAPVFQDDLDKVKVAHQASIDSWGKRVIQLETWRYGLGVVMVVLCGMVTILLKSYKAQVVITRDKD